MNNARNVRKLAGTLLVIIWLSILTVGCIALVAVGTGMFDYH